MPGIVGLQTRMPRGWAEPQLKRMVETLQHEAFYKSGTWIDEALGIYVGWVERGDSSPTDMPLINGRQDHVLIFSGEEFSDNAVHHLSSDESKQRYLVGLAESDPRFPACLNGRFHGVHADRVRGTTTLFNDRYGMHRLYYHASKEAFYFAAEAKAILAVRAELRQVEPRALSEYVTCGCVLENRTLFKKIQVLPCASLWRLRDGKPEEQGAYFLPSEWEQQESLDDDKYYRELRDVFVASLPRYFAGTEPIGVSLTGGLDTRMIMAWHKAAPGSLPCYTFGGLYRECQDVIVARKVAQACWQRHQVIQVGREFLARFHHYAKRTVYLTDGCADVRRASDLFLNERAREIAPVRMTGNYGSEVLRAVRAFKPTAPPAIFHKDLVQYVAQAEDTYENATRCHPVSFAVFRQAPWHHYGLLALEQTQVSVRSPYLDNNLVRTAFRAPSHTFMNNDICLRVVEEGNPYLRRIPTDRSIGAPGILGAVSRHFDQFLTKAEYAYDYGMPQWVAGMDHYVSGLHLERLFLGRQKFSHYRVWYRDSLAQYVREILLDPRSLSRPYIARSNVECVVARHLRGDRNYTNEIHHLITLELVHRLFIDKP